MVDGGPLPIHPWKGIGRVPLLPPHCVKWRSTWGRKNGRTNDKAGLQQQGKMRRQRLRLSRRSLDPAEHVPLPSPSLLSLLLLFPLLRFCSTARPACSKKRSTVSQLLLLLIVRVNNTIIIIVACSLFFFLLLFLFLPRFLPLQLMCADPLSKMRKKVLPIENGTAGEKRGGRKRNGGDWSSVLPWKEHYYYAKGAMLACVGRASKRRKEEVHLRGRYGDDDFAYSGREKERSLLLPKCVFRLGPPLESQWWEEWGRCGEG